MHCNAAQCNLSSCSTGPLIHARIKEEVGIIWLLLTDGLCVPVTPSVYFNLQLSLIHIWGALSNQQYGIEGPPSWVQCITALRCILPVLSLPHCVSDDTPPPVALIRDQEDGIGGPSPTWVGLVVCSRSEGQCGDGGLTDRCSHQHHFLLPHATKPRLPQVQGL